ncbi:MAG: hypothetical protein FJ399_11600 [Verrucomicrobia bacterium]|nr:hypothetical protein [Verrucomicrobiota bacterium]
MSLLAILIYVGLSCLVAYLGRERKFGFWGYLVASVFLSPLMGALLVLGSDPRAAAAAPAAPAS